MSAAAAPKSRPPAGWPSCSGVATEVSRVARRPRSHCGCCGPARTGRTGCGATPLGPGTPGGGPTGTWTRSAPCSMSRRVARRSPGPGTDRLSGRDREPADPRRPDAGVDLRGGRVRLPHRAPGEGPEWTWWSWPGSMEGTWPEVRRRGSLLEADRLGRQVVNERHRRRAGSPRSAGCMWPAPGPGPGWCDGRRGTEERVTSPRAFSLSSAYRSGWWGDPGGRCRWPRWSASCAVSVDRTLAGSARAGGEPAGPAQRCGQ